jgi:DNA-directed RNA polymerase subunit RPC12/RpoP
MRKPCDHISMQDAVSCARCNPRRLSMREYVACGEYGLNPRRPNRRALARAVAQMAAEAAGKQYCLRCGATAPAGAVDPKADYLLCPRCAELEAAAACGDDRYDYDDDEYID